MEKKINIAELLKDCPKGMELDCAMFEDVFFDEITNNKIFPICVKRIDGHPVILTKHGGYANCPSSKCVIFPKGKTTWEGFVPPCKFKDGDIIYVKDKYNQEWCSILSNYEDGKLYTYIDFCINNNTFYRNKPNILCEHKDIIEYRLAAEEEKEKLFDAIKANGYKWNAETKTLEDLTESKEDVDDEILMSGIYFDREYHADEVELHLGNYEIEIRDGRTYAVLKNQKTKTFELPKFKVGDEIKQIGSDRHYIIKNIEFDRYILNNNQFIRFTDEHIYELAPNKLVEPKFKVGDRIVKKNSVCVPILITNISDEFYYSNTGSSVGVLSISEQDEYELVLNKFDINTLVPFESKVLVRNANNKVWRPTIFGCYMKDKYEPFYMLGGTSWKQCIPYEGNEHLLGKTYDCNEYFKTWE